MTIPRFHISPTFSAIDRQTFAREISAPIFREIEAIQNEIDIPARTFTVKGFCIPCNRNVSFKVDKISGTCLEHGMFIPNWRERLVCPLCNMSNRQRLIAALVMQHLQDTPGQQIYLMEQMTPLYQWVAENLPGQIIFGSEYLGADFRGGETIKAWNYNVPIRLNALCSTTRYKARLFFFMLRLGGIRHEDVAALSFETGTMDLIVSNDVFEHVPDPTKAFAECARVLRSGGVMLATIPFHYGNDASIKRVECGQDGLKYLLPPIYHGNPLSASGSLVFTDFGWDVIRNFHDAGFSEVAVEVYASAKHGHLGGGLSVFRMKR